jgi:hypothetical protein
MEVVRGLVGSLRTLQLARQRAAQRTYQQPHHSTSPRSEDREGGERESSEHPADGAVSQ